MLTQTQHVVGSTGVLNNHESYFGKTDTQALLLKYLRYLKIVAYLSGSAGRTHFARTIFKNLARAKLGSALAWLRLS